MLIPLTIQGELRLPGVFLTDHGLDACKQLLETWGVLPPHAEQRRWRPDAEAPGNYVLTYVVVLPAQEAP
jgi:hypothetical protein